MARFCSNCGSPLYEGANACTNCGCPVNPAQPFNNTPPYNQGQPYNQAFNQAPQYNPYPQYNTTQPKKTSVALILGIIGIVAAWVIALAGHILSIIGIVCGIKEYNETGNITGLVLSIVGEVCSILSSIIGAVTMMSLI
ncbi:MAG: hypothetical protein IIX54_01780 [Clostridia bacterium]|nr:hypothetical protein [Clostridia bacterium]